MAKAYFIIPCDKNGNTNWESLGIAPELITGYVVASYTPPPPGAALFNLVLLETTAATITALTNRADCLYICDLTDDGAPSTAAINATQRNAVRTKVTNMGFTGAKYGLLNAAIQASQKRDELSLAIATKAFFRDVKGTPMTEVQLRGTTGRDVKAVVTPGKERDD